jgi:hypothetical protein
MAKVQRVSNLKQLQPEREHMHLMLLQNPNYFGTLSKKSPLIKEYKPVMIIQGNATFEQVTCVGYNPQMKSVSAIVRLNKSNGYSGGPCADGSREYVRFYIDYERNGNWKDLGLAGFTAHDFSETGKHPVCYAVNLAFTPDVTHCCDDKPVLPLIRAILSWNAAPTPDDPDYIPVWGNVLNVNAQLAPRTGWICWLKHNLHDIGLVLKPEQLKLFEEKMPQLPEAFDLQTEEVSLSALTKIYKKEVQEERIGFTTIAKAMKAGVPKYELTTQLKNAGLNISKIIDFALSPKFNTTYEEVKCVGLDRDSCRLYATIVVKKQNGYAGSLCARGSREYIGFYMDFGAGWEFMGTSSVAVHDVTPMPGGGLSYHVELPVNLIPHQKRRCSETYFAKVRAILSWNLYPPDNQPDWVAPWGDREDAWVEIRHRIQGDNDKRPVITTIGSIPTKKISSISGMIEASLDAPNAAVDGYDQFSFNGIIPITGQIPNAPDSNDVSSQQVSYRIMLKKAGTPDSNFAPVMNHFDVLKNVITGGVLTQSVVTQTPDGDGYYNYLQDYTSPKLVTVHGDLFGVISVADSDVYEFYLETSEGFLSERRRVKVDKHPPKNITIKVNGSEDCGSLIKGTDITGTYSLADEENNCDSVSFEFITLKPGDSTTLKVDGIVRSFGSQVSVPVSGKTGTWSISTNNIRKCGYNIRLRAYDKTLVCRAFVSYAYYAYQQYDSETIGFCLNEA